MTVDSPLLVACLCAEWCGACRDYRGLFEQLASDFGDRARFDWVDIEDHADVPAALDIETFPTLLLARGDRVLFFGPLLPRANVLARTIEKALGGELADLTDPALAGLPARVRAVADAA